MPKNTHTPFELDISWESKLEHVTARCHRNLSYYPSIDADDPSQEAMIQLLRVDFLKNYSPERSSLIAYTNGMIDNVCRKAIQRWYQSMNNQSPIDLAILISNSSNPEESAIVQEIFDDIKSAQQRFSAAELRALPQVLERASGSRSVCKSDPKPNYSAESRCRAKLRRTISHHAPAKDECSVSEADRTLRHRRPRSTKLNESNPG